MDGLTFASNVLTFISNVIASVAWPAVAIFLIYLLRPQLGDLAERLRELTLPGTKAIFGEKLVQVREQFEAVEAKGDISAPVLEEAERELTDDEKYREIARIFPAAAILIAFKQIEDAAESYYEQYPKSKRHNLTTVVKTLADYELISPEIFRLFIQVRELRNLAAHGNDKVPGVTESEALDYYRLCQVLAVELREAIKQLPGIAKQKVKEMEGQVKENNP